jgi:hypothetical protein
MNIHAIRDHLELMRARALAADLKRAEVPNPSESTDWQIDNMIGMCGDDAPPQGRHAGPRTTLGSLLPGRHRTDMDWWEQ